jgi:hypothetical protein
MVATIYSIGTIIQFQFIFAVIAVFYYLIVSAPVDLQISDTFKIIYLCWFILDTIRLYSVKHKFVRAISFLHIGIRYFHGMETLWFPGIY